MIENIEKISHATFRNGTSTDNVFACKWFSDLIDVQIIARDLARTKQLSNHQFIDLFNLNEEMKALNEIVLDTNNIVDDIKEPIDQISHRLGQYISECQKRGYDPYNEEKGKSADLSFMVALGEDIDRFM